MADSKKKSANIINAAIPSETVRTTVTSLSNGGIELSISNATWTNCRYTNIPVVANVKYTLSIYIDEYSGTGTFMIPFRQIDGNGTVISTDTITQTGTITHTFTAEGSTVWLSLYLNNSGTAATATAKIRIMLNEGATALPYQPYSATGWQHSLRKLTTATEAVENPLYSDGTAITAYTLNGNTVQNGTPTPSNPVEVNGVGNAASNIMPYATAQTISDNGITVTSDGQGTYHVEGLATADTNISLTIPDFTIPVCVGSGGNGTMALFNGRIGSAQGDSRLEFYDGSTRIDGWQLIQANRTSTTYGAGMDGKNCNKINIFIKSGVSANADLKPMFTNDGTLPTTYEPYGYKIPISSGQQTTNIYLGSTQTTRQIKKLVLTGGQDETWTYNIAPGIDLYRARFENLPNAAITECICSHYKYEFANVDGNVYINSTLNQITFCDNINATDDTTWRTYLAQQYANGTPVTVWYVLATAETGTVNEPVMKIGDYADTLRNAAQIPTTEGANSITVDTTVQPSEFTATWTGWHNANVKEWDGSDWS